MLLKLSGCLCILLDQAEETRTIMTLQRYSFVVLVTVQWQMEMISILEVSNDLLTYLISQSSK